MAVDDNEPELPEGRMLNHFNVETPGVDIARLGNNSFDLCLQNSDSLDHQSVPVNDDYIQLNHVTTEESVTQQVQGNFETKDCSIEHEVHLERNGDDSYLQSKNLQRNSVSHT